MKRYKIPIVFQKIEYYDVNAENLQEAVETALKEFFKKPEDGYLEDSFEVDGIIEDNYPNETYDINKAMQKI